MTTPTPTQQRPSWDDYFMSIARLVATRGTCDRLDAGAVLVKENRIVSTGYLGAPKGLPHCDEVGHLMEEGHCVRTVHGEHNAILQAARTPGATTEGTTMYTMYSPCIHCAKYIVAAGVKRIVIGKVYRNAPAMDYLQQAGLEVCQYQRNEAWDRELSELFAQDIPERHPKEGDVHMDEVK